MSGTFTSKTLAGGYLSNTQTVLYQTPSANVAYIKTFSITSNSANTQSINLYRRINGNVLPWYTFQLSLGDTADILDIGALVLSANDGILAQTNVSTANAAAYSMHGVEEK